MPRIAALILATALLLPRSSLADDDSIMAQLITNARDAYVLQIQAIREAAEIWHSTFIYGSDPVAMSFSHEMVEAARQGARVHNLVDYVGSVLTNGDRDVFSYMKVQGVDTRIFNAITLRNIPGFNRRQHGKILAVRRRDGELVVFLGGRNKWAQSYGLTAKPQLDMEIMLVGHNARVVVDYFNRRWNGARISEIKNPYDDLPANPQRRRSEEIEIAKRLANGASQISSGVYDLQAWRGTRQLELGNAPSDFFYVEDWDFVFDGSAVNDREHTDHVDVIVDMINEANESIIIESPWIVFTRKVSVALQAARRRNVSVTILTNSRESSEDPMRYEISRVGAQIFADRHNISVLEYSGIEALHSKYIIVDGRQSYVGSFNIGPRSQYLNSETGMLTSSQRITDRLLAEFNRRVEYANKAPRYNYFRDSFCRRIFYWAMSTQL